MQIFKRLWPSKPLPLFQACSVYASDRIIGILTVKQVGRARQADFDVGTFEARLPIDESSLLAACRTALDRSCAVPTAEIRAFPDYLETVRRFKLWTDTLRKLDGRKSIYTVWQKMELVEIERDDTGYKVVPLQKVRFQEFTAMIGLDGQPISFRFDRLEDAVVEMRRRMARP
jgi:hypothetical protein